MSTGFAVIDRYDVLGIPRPDPKTMCQGQCEGTGIVPAFINPGLCEEGRAYCENELDPVLIGLWKEAEAKSPAVDGWHFVKCPDCAGSGIAPQS